MAVITIYATKDASALKAFDGWSGWDNHLPIGTSSSGNTYCSFVSFPISFTGWTGITDAKLWIRGHRASAGNHVLGDASGNTRTLYARRMTSDWGEGADRGETNWSSSEPWGWNNRRGALTDANAATKIFTGYSEGTWYSIDVTGIVNDWYNGTANYGFSLAFPNDTEENSSSNALEFYARDAGSGYKPYLEITYSTNTAPNAPTSLSPTANALVNTLTPTLTATRSDPDTNDYITAYQIKVFNSDLSVMVWDSGTVLQLGSSSTFSKVYAGNPLNGNNFYKWQARTRDKGSAWGPFNATLSQFKVNSPPNPPKIQISETPTSDLRDLTPTLNVTHDDNDVSDTKMYGYHIVLETSTGSAIWDSGDIDTSSTPVSTLILLYSGPSLSWRTGYRWRAKTKDINGVWGPYSANATFTTHSTDVPTALDPSTETISSLVPAFYGTRLTSSDTIVSYQIILYASDGVTSVWDSGTQTAGISGGSSFSKTGPTLGYGLTYKWKARITGLIGGTSVYSTLQTFTAPADASLAALNYPTTNLNNRVTTLIPTFTGSRASAFTNYEVEVYPSTASSTLLGTKIWTSGNIAQTSATTFSLVYSGSSLVWNTTYKWRVRVGSPTLGSWTGLATFSTDVGGTPTLTAPVNNAWINTSTPTFTGSSANSESIIAVRIRVYDYTGIALIWDSGDLTQTGATTFSKVYAGPSLNGGSDYQWEARYTKSTGPTGNYAPRRSFRRNGIPKIPTGLSPVPGFTFSNTLLPTFKATYDDPDRVSKGDYPVGWVIEIRNSSTDALIATKTLTANLLAGSNTYTWGSGDAAMSYNVEYKWRTWFTDSMSSVGASSSYQVFTLGQPPTVAIISPSNGSNVSTTRPLITWTFSNPSGGAQLKYRVRIIRSATGTVSYDSGYKVSALTQFQMPSGYLSRNGESYQIDVWVVNAGGLLSVQGTSEFQLQLDAPPKIEGLSTTVYESLSKVVLDWDKSALGIGFVSYVIYRRQVGEDDWGMIGTRKPESNAIFTDWYAGQKTIYEYRVTVVKKITDEPDLESPDSDIASASLQSDTWFVVGRDRADEHIFELPVSSEDHNRPVQQETFEPLGTNRKAVVRGFVLGHEGSFELMYREDETYMARAQIEYLLYYAGPHILKNPFGDVFDVTFGSPDYKYQGGGSLGISISYIEVGKTSNPLLTPEEYLAQIGAE